MFHSDKITDTEKVGGFKVCHTEGKCRADRKLGMGKAPLSTFREISKTLKKLRQFSVEELNQQAIGYPFQYKISRKQKQSIVLSQTFSIKA